MSYDWSKVAEALKDPYQFFIIPDLRGHGLSDYRAGEISIEAVNADLRGLIADEQLEPPHVLGFSFGAEAALELELTYPGTAASLILVSPGLGDPKSSVFPRGTARAALARHARSTARGAPRTGPLARRDARALRSGGETRRRRIWTPSAGSAVPCFLCLAARTTRVACGRRR